MQAIIVMDEKHTEGRMQDVMFRGFREMTGKTKNLYAGLVPVDEFNVHAQRTMQNDYRVEVREKHAPFYVVASSIMDDSDK